MTIRSTDERHERQIINAATKCAEERIKSGKASDQLLLHYLRQGTAKANLEREKLRNENLLLQAKTQAIEAGEEREVLYKQAIEAFTSYVMPPEDEE